MTLERYVYTALGACVFVSATGFGYLLAVRFVERQIRLTAEAKWD
jgi:hypothetical protein